jgi:hypothetical protein
MKNLFKIAAIVLSISVSAAACNGNKDKTGSDTSKNVDSPKIVKDTLKNDTTIKDDSTKKDTTIKTVVKTTETKKK